MRVLNRITEYLSMIRFSHSVFALPFAYSGAVLAKRYAALDLNKIFWITAAMVSVRSAAMGFNRLMDKNLDALNPRTEKRALPAGRISVKAVFIFILISLLIFFLSAAMLNRLTLFLSPLAACIVLSYSYTKRYTAMSHYILGLSLSIAPVGAWIGVTAEFHYLPFLLASGVLFWVAGFDIIYSLLDVEWDKRNGIRTIPSNLGIKKGLIVAALSQLLAFSAFTVVYILSINIIIAVTFLFLILSMLLYQHKILDPTDEKSIERAFFNGNSVIGVLFFLGIFLNDLVS